MPRLNLIEAALLAAFLVAASAAPRAGPAPARAEGAAAISDADVEYFYKNPSPDRVAQIIGYFAATLQPDRPAGQPPVIGFLAAVFQKYPNDLDRMIPADLPLPMLAIVGVSLRIAGRDAQAAAVAGRLEARGAAAPDYSHLPAGLDAMPLAGPTEFDMLWGASFATGDPRYCSRILERFAGVANRDGNAQDMLTIVRGMNAPADLRWVTDKHGPDKARELINVSSALWSLDSNARQHDFVRKVVGDYVDAHPAEPASKALAALAQDYGRYDLKRLLSLAEGPPGKSSVNIDIAYLSRILDDLGRHAGTYPPNFQSAEDRQRAQRDVSALSKAFEPIYANIAGNPQLLLRLALLHVFAHNLDVVGSAEKAVAEFDALLKLTPDDPLANYRYGIFLATTTRGGAAIPYLEKAKSLGVANADYWLGMSYQLAGDKAKAILNLESYTRRVPGDQDARKVLDAVRNGKVDVKELPPAR